MRGVVQSVASFEKRLVVLYMARLLSLQLSLQDLVKRGTDCC